MTLPPGAYEIENLNIDKKGNIIEEGHFTKIDYPFTIKPNFSTIGSSIIEISRQEPIFTFLPNDSIGDLLKFNATTINEDYNLSPTLLIFYRLIILSSKQILLKEKILKVRDRI